MFLYNISFLNAAGVECSFGLYASDYGSAMAILNGCGVKPLSRLVAND